MTLKRKILFGTTVLAGIVAVAAPAFAQSTGAVPGGDAAAQLDEVVVTGSRIRRDPTTSATPLIQVTRQELLATGQNTVIDYLATIPALSNSRIPSDTTNTAVDGLGLLGLSTANLRSLGSNRTLTLIDGRRQVGSSQGTLLVDIDTIPRLLIQSVEIITGGASSVYGADAVSGVLNFVLRKDFEGLEIDANYGQINQGGQANKRISALAGVNLFDDRLNVWGFGEYEKIDELSVMDIDWFAKSPILLAIDADQAGFTNDGAIDSALFFGVNTLGRIRGGQTTLANTQQASRLNNPLIPYATCNATSAAGFQSANCYPVDPAKTYVFDNGAARLANFGQRIGTGYSRTANIGGDGESNANVAQESRTPANESQRYAAGLNFKVAHNINLSLDAKYVTEDASANGQPTFFDVFIIDKATPVANGAGVVQPQYTFGPSNFTQFQTRTDNAFLPQNLREAILANTLINYAAPTLTADGVAGATVAAPFARHSTFGPTRGQRTNRELQRYVAALDGDLDKLLFIKNFSWGLSYEYGKAKIDSFETGVDAQRFAMAVDSVVDFAGAVSGKPGQVVCRAQLIEATTKNAKDNYRGGLLSATAEGRAELAGCTPYNVFGRGAASQAAEDYVYAEVNYSGVNEQEQAIVSTSGQLWDFWGAGPIGVALGYEHRREFTKESGRNANNRLLFLNESDDFPGAELTSDEVFGELSLPLFKDSFLGKYAEISGSYRYFDYSTVGTGDVYGVNLLYRPTSQIAFKSSYNTSFRAPNLGENFSPQGQTYANSFTDPCATTSIAAATTAEIKANRIKNCEALAVARGYAPGFFDFANATATNTDDFVPTYSSGIAGLDGGNPNLSPEESTSFTFSTVLTPSFIPNFSLVLDYYEIEITNAIASLTVAQIAANCVDGPALSPGCNSLFRNTPMMASPTSPQDRSEGFKLGDPATQVGFIQGAVNYQGFQTRGLDFTANYKFDTEEMLGRNFGRFAYSLRGSWLIEQKSFVNPSVPTDFTEAASGLNYPRVRFSSSLTWAPNDALSINWTLDWQTAQDISRQRDLVAANNLDSRLVKYYTTKDFARNDFTVQYKVRDDLSLRAGVVNVFDNEQPAWLGTNFVDNLDPYGRRFFVGFNYRPF